MTDWQRVAKPQADQYDSDVVIALAGWPKRPTNGVPSFCDELVALRISKREFGPDIRLAALDHPNIAIGEAYLKMWPDGFLSFVSLIGTVYPLLDISVVEFARGSTCGSDESEWGSLYATVYDPMGFAEACVHELGHQKLRGLGVFLEHSTGLIMNDQDDLFTSPIRKDKQRPMTAVFHAEYSYTHVVELDYQILSTSQDEVVKQSALSQIRINYPKIAEIYPTIQSHLVPEEGKESFFDGFYSWFDDLTARVQELNLL